MGGHSEQESTLNQLLVEMDGEHKFMTLTKRGFNKKTVTAGQWPPVRPFTAVS